MSESEIREEKCVRERRKKQRQVRKSCPKDDWPLEFSFPLWMVSQSQAQRFLSNFGPLGTPLVNLIVDIMIHFPVMRLMVYERKRKG